MEGYPFLGRRSHRREGIIAESVKRPRRAILQTGDCPMARPLWSGSIQISLVGFAVEIYPATNTTKPFSFHEIDRNTMTRVKRQSVSPGPASGEDAGDGLAETQANEEPREGNKA